MFRLKAEMLDDGVDEIAEENLDYGWNETVEIDPEEKDLGLRKDPDSKTYGDELKEDILLSDTDVGEPDLDIVGEVTSGKCGLNLTWKLENGLLTISGSGDMDDLTYMYGWEPDDDGFEDEPPWPRDNIEEIIIESGVTSIGEGMFNECQYVMKVTIPNSVTVIKARAFIGCKNLKEVSIPDSGLISIRDYAFSGCNILTVFNMPKTVESVGVEAFSYCHSIINVFIPEGLSSIGKDAFLDSVASNIEVDENNTAYTVYQDVLYNKSKDILIKCPLGKEGAITIPDSVTRLSDNAFYGCEKITSVIISKNIKNIGVGAFWYCIGLKEIYFTGNAPIFEGVVKYVDDVVYEFPSNAFHGVTAAVYYPANNSTWTDDIRENYHGIITWVPVTGDSMISTPTITNVYNSAKGGDIRWTAVSDCVGYVVYRERAAEGIKKVATINDPKTTQCFDPAIKDNCYGRVYHYYVTALYKDSSGKIVESDPSDKLVLQRLAPMKITNSIQTSGSSVSFNWACSVSENKSYGYEVQYAEKNTDLYDRVGTFKAFPVEGRSNLSVAISGLKSGKKYWIRVRCYVNYTHSITGELTKTWSQYSNIVTIKLASVSNTTPAYQVTDSVANYRSGIWIYWTPTNAKGYNVYRKIGANGQWQKIAYVAGQEAYRYHDAAVKDKNGVMYYYTVRGVIGSKLSDYDKNGRGIMRLIPADFTKAENSAAETVILKWNKNNVATGYEVEYSKDKEFAEVISSVTVTSNTVTTEIKGLEMGKVYYFRARAYTVKGQTVRKPSLT